MATVPCPIGPDPEFDGCMTKTKLDDLYDLMDTLADRVNAIKTIMDETPIDKMERQEDGCITKTTFQDILDWIGDVAIASGYVKMYAEDDNGTPIGDPTTREEVVYLEACDAFWLSLTDVTDCMLLELELEGCLKAKLMKELTQLLTCLTTEECAPCQCPVCQSTDGNCYVCNRCITLQVEYEGYCTLDAFNAVGITNLCVMDQTGSNLHFITPAGDEVPGLRLTVEIHVVKGWVMWKLYITDSRYDLVPIIYRGPFDIQQFGDDKPSPKCSELVEKGRLVLNNGNAMYGQTYQLDMGSVPNMGTVGTITSGEDDPFGGGHGDPDDPNPPDPDDTAEMCPPGIGPQTTGMFTSSTTTRMSTPPGMTHNGREFMAVLVQDQGVWTLYLYCGSESIAMYSGGHTEAYSGCDKPEGLYSLALTDPLSWPEGTTNPALVTVLVHHMNGGDAMVNMRMGFPICNKPWCGVRRCYTIDTMAIPVCPDSPTDNCLGMETDGRVVLNGDKLELANVSQGIHLGHAFYPTIDFSTVKCAYRLTLAKSAVDDTVVWRGYKYGCGGPEGNYQVDPEMMTEPCFNGQVTVYATWLKPWLGVRPCYKIDMDTVPTCTSQPTWAPPETDGTLVRQGFSMVVPQAAHNGHVFYAIITFDEDKVAYVLTIHGFRTEAPVWRGFNYEYCSGPAGDYEQDPDFVNPCFEATVTVVSTWVPAEIGHVYTLNMGDIPECETCEESAEPETTGEMHMVGNKLVLTSATPVSHLGRDFYAEVDYDYPNEMYRLNIYCEEGGNLKWSGLKEPCSGPQGTYTTSAGIQDPYFIGTVTLSY